MGDAVNVNVGVGVTKIGTMSSQDAVSIILIVKSEYELKSTDNGKTAIDFNLENGDEVKCSSNGMDKLIPLF